MWRKCRSCAVASGQMRGAQSVTPKLQSAARHTAVTGAQVIGIVFRSRVLIRIAFLLSPLPARQLAPPTVIL